MVRKRRESAVERDEYDHAPSTPLLDFRALSSRHDWCEVQARMTTVLFLFIPTPAV